MEIWSAKIFLAFCWRAIDVFLKMLKLKIVNFYGTRLSLGIASGFRYLVNGDLNVFHSRRESGCLMIMVFCGIVY